MATTIFDEWQVTLRDIDEIIINNPSLRGFLFGYVAEYKLREIWFSPTIFHDVGKHDNHDRHKKGDLFFTYDGVNILIESKSLQTSTVRKLEDGTYIAKAQVDASDSREITLPSGEKIKTTCLLVGEFDLLAVNLFPFQKKWEWAFAKNSDLPRTKYFRYSEDQRQYLLATTVTVTWPLQDPFRPEPFELIKEIVKDRKR
ncbi:MAG: restriction endonuclease [Candidatus Thorarchaeota archaeon]|nr:restriction endonuclease [Candidatus Thorarchaeota archaeon]